MGSFYRRAAWRGRETESGCSFSAAFFLAASSLLIPRPSGNRAGHFLAGDCSLNWLRSLPGPMLRNCFLCLRLFAKAIIFAPAK